MWEMRNGHVGECFLDMQYTWLAACCYRMLRGGFCFKSYLFAYSIGASNTYIYIYIYIKKCAKIGNKSDQWDRN